MNKKLMRKKLALMLANLKKKRPFYTELEYLESSGTQYIDTGIIPTINTDVEVYCRWTQNNRINTILGGGNAYGNNEILICPNLISANGIIFEKGNANNIRKSNAQNYVNQDHRYRIIGGNCYFDDELLGTYTLSTISTNNSIYLMSYHRNTGSGEYFIGRFYYTKIWDNDTLVRDFIPVLDWNYVPCMYDKVTGQLFYNAGTGNFVAGRQIHQVEYIESTGTQYIDTGVIPSGKKISSEFSFKLNSIVTNGTNGIFGSNTQDNSNNCQFQVYRQQWRTKLNNFASYNGTWDTNEHIVKFNTANGTFLDDTRITSTQYTILASNTYPLRLFGVYYAYPNLYYDTQGRIYYCKIWDNEILVRDFIPAIDENDTYFMFDKVSHTAYNNAGSGSFIGPTVAKDGNGKIIEPEYE